MNLVSSFIDLQKSSFSFTSFDLGLPKFTNSYHFTGEVIDLNGLEKGEEKRSLRNMMSDDGYSIDDSQRLFCLINLGYSSCEIYQTLKSYKEDSFLRSSRDILFCNLLLDVSYNNEGFPSATKQEEIRDIPQILKQLCECMQMGL